MPRILPEIQRWRSHDKRERPLGAAGFRKNTSARRKAIVQRCRAVSLSCRHPPCSQAISSECSRAHVGDERRVSFAYAADEYLRRAAVYGRDERTAFYQVEILKRHFGSMWLDEIQPEHVEQMFRERLEGDQVCRPTLNRQLAALSAIFRLQIKRQRFRGPNPCLLVDRFPEHRERFRWLLPEESKLLAARAGEPHIRLAILIGLWTGGRLQEILGVRPEDCEWFPSPISLDKGKLAHGFVNFRKQTTKGHKHRQVPIGDDLARVLRGWPTPPPGLPYVWWRGRCLRSIRTGFETARRAAGLGADVVVHTLRHTYASWHMMNGGDLYVLQALLGHSTSKQTEKYAHLSPKHLRKSAAFVGLPLGIDGKD